DLSYHIKEAKGILPRVKVVGITQCYTNEELEELVEHVVKTNSTIFDLNSVCNVLKFWPTKKDPKIFQALIQVDKQSYENLISSGGLFVGYDCCTVFDALEVMRCFTCSGYGHTSRVCKSKRFCPKCSEEHDIKDCKAVTLKCINCVNLGKRQGRELESA